MHPANPPRTGRVRQALFLLERPAWHGRNRPTRYLRRPLPARLGLTPGLEPCREAIPAAPPPALRPIPPLLHLALLPILRRLPPLHNALVPPPFSPVSLPLSPPLHTLPSPIPTSPPSASAASPLPSPVRTVSEASPKALAASLRLLIRLVKPAEAVGMGRRGAAERILRPRRGPAVETVRARRSLLGRRRAKRDEVALACRRRRRGREGFLRLGGRVRR